MALHQNFDGIFGDRKIDIIYSAIVMNTMYQQQKLGKHCDLKVLVGEREYSVHRCVLAAASTKLDSQVDGIDKIQLVGVSYYGFECLVEILYCGKLQGISSLSENNLVQIIQAADALSAETVMKYCLRERSDFVKNLLSDQSSNETNLLLKNINDSIHNNKTSTEDIKPKCRTLDTKTKNCSNEEVATDKLIHLDATTDFNQGFNNVVDPQIVGREVTVESNLNGNISSGPIFPFNEVKLESEYTSATLVCHICGQIFKNSLQLNEHTMTTHLKEMNLIHQSSQLHLNSPALSPLIKSSSTSYKCLHCHFETQTYEQLETHIRSNHNQVTTKEAPTMLPKTTTEKNKRKMDQITPLISPTALNSLTRGADGKYNCPFCQRGFDRRWNLKCHILIHTSKKNEGTNTNKTDARYLPCTISCPKCTRGFRSMHNLRRHACSKHGLNQNELTVAMKMAEGVKQVATLKRTSPETTTTTASTVPPTKKTNQSENEFK